MLWSQNLEASLNEESEPTGKKGIDIYETSVWSVTYELCFHRWDNRQPHPPAVSSSAHVIVYFSRQPNGGTGGVLGFFHACGGNFCRFMISTYLYITLNIFVFSLEKSYLSPFHLSHKQIVCKFSINNCQCGNKVKIKLNMIKKFKIKLKDKKVLFSLIVVHVLLLFPIPPPHTTSHSLASLCFP